MKRSIALAVLLLSSPAFAHTSLAPHAHPHGASALPDYFALLVAALLVGAGYAALRAWKRR